MGQSLEWYESGGSGREEGPSTEHDLSGIRIRIFMPGKEANRGDFRRDDAKRLSRLNDTIINR